MFDIFQKTTRTERNLFFSKNDPHDVRMGEIVFSSPDDYQACEIVILGCPQDEGVRRNKGRIGAALAPVAIRRQFFKLTDFGISLPIFDLGDTIIQENLEATHNLQTEIVERVLADEKRLIILGGGNDISYADGAAMAKAFGSENWTAFNIDAHFDVRLDSPRNSGTPYRQLLDEHLLTPENFSQIAFQSQVNSSIYFDYLKNLGVTAISLEEIRDSKIKIQDMLNLKLSNRNTRSPIFFGFDTDSVRAADAPGVSAPSPIGLTAEEFVDLAGFAGDLNETKIVEFTEMNPNFDVDNRTAKLVAVAMHRFCRSIKKEG